MRIQSVRYVNLGMEFGMARAAIDNDRIDLRIPRGDKALLTRAAALERLDLTGFILRAVLPKARSIAESIPRGFSE